MRMSDEKVEVVGLEEEGVEEVDELAVAVAAGIGAEAGAAKRGT